jgi:hypothetical protein
MSIDDFLRAYGQAGEPPTPEASMRKVPNHKSPRPSAPAARSKADAEHKKFIDSARWKRTSAEYRRARPACEWCLARGLIVGADHVHHERGQDPEYYTDWAALWGACKSCHSRITLQERRGQPVEYPTRKQTAGEEPFEYA